MKVTRITSQQKSPNRVNVFIGGAYRFSLDIFQVSDLGICVGKEYTEEELVQLEEESTFGKLYARALEYTMIRPHSAKEIKDYLWRKTLNKRLRNKTTGELYEKKGVSKKVTERVFDRLLEKKHIDDTAFARWWVENRSQRKGTSFRKLELELRSKGVSSEDVKNALSVTERDEKAELVKMIEKKSRKYDNEQKLIAYLVRQGFSYDVVRDALSESVIDE